MQRPIAPGLLLGAILLGGFFPERVRAQDLLPGAESLRAAIEDLAATFPESYPDAERLLQRLDELCQQAATARAAKTEKLIEQLEKLRRRALLANPLLDAPILFVRRHQYRRDHHNTATMFQTGEINTGSFQGGAALRVLDVRSGRTKTLLELPEGVVRDPDVHFDGRRIVVSLRRDRSDDYHIWQLAADGSSLVQLTFGQGVSDIDPIYLPDDRILFTSTREPKYCMCNRHIMGNLFVMNADGSNIHQIGHSTLHEGHATLLPDGSVLYDRWEYVDRNFGDAQGLWTTRPDGTGHAVYWGNNTNSPGGVIDGRVIAGTSLCVCVFTSCHDRPWGAVALVDRRRGLDLALPVVRTWPAEAIDLVGKGNYDTFKRVAQKFEDPWPLSEKYFLCSGMTGRGEQMGIWLVDVFGNQLLLHVEKPGCFDPMPLAQRPRPPVLPDRTDLAATEGYFYVADVYRGYGMEEVPRGSVAWLRVVESPEKRFWTRPAWDGGTGQQAPAMAWNDFNNKRILGTVPVEPDGSAYFAVPADTFVYFQLLDRQGRMIQSMRSGTIVRPGETQGCGGCHESRRATVSLDGFPQAMRKGPQKLRPWYGPPRNFNYLAEVQPVFDAHCVICHDYRKPAGLKLNLSGDLNLVFNTSYVELRSKGYVRVPGAGPHNKLRPKSWGSQVSRLAQVILHGHGDPQIDCQLRLTAEDRDRVLTWIDINAPYYPDYGSAYRDNPFGRSPLTSEQLKRLGQLVGLDLGKPPHIDEVNFTRPELSPCLERIADQQSPQYREALAIIRSGSRLLAQRPRADMPGFRLRSPVELAQQAKYQRRLQIEQQMRSAIIRGLRRFERTGAGASKATASPSGVTP